MQTTTKSSSPFVAAYESRKSDTARSHTFIECANPLSYGDLLDRIERLATYFDELGLSAGDRVMVASDHGTHYATLVLALMRCGIAAVPVNPNSSMAEFTNIVTKADIRAAFLDQDTIEENGFEATENCKLIGIAEQQKKSLFDRFKKTKTENSSSNTYPAILDEYEPSKSLPSDLDTDTVAYILFTSGTTSEPKGVEITHGNLIAHCKTLANQYRMDDTTRLLDILPLYHTDGLAQGPLFMFAIGGTVCRPMTFHLDKLGELLDQVYKLRITHWLTVPTVVALAVEFGEDYRDAMDTPDFEFAISTAGYLDEGIWRQFEEKFNTQLVNVYGLTETVCEGLYCGPDEETRRIGTIGKPVDMDARVLDADGNEVAQGEIGELTLRGDNVMKGYLNMPEETAKVLRDGWFSTGDLVRVDEDGFFHIAGRKKNIIISGGLNVYPEDVASVLRQIDGVVDATVFGVEDHRWGERVAACVEINPASDLTTGKLREEFLKLASSDMVPHEIGIVDELPRGPAGKVIIDQARKLLEVGDGNTDDASAGIEERVIAAASRVFGVSVESLSASSSRSDTEGWSSLAHVDLILAIEKNFGFRMESRDVMTIRNLKNVIDIASKQVS